MINMGEPLKYKSRCHDDTGNRYRYDFRIKSAVAWLKKELKDRDLLPFATEHLIKEAFEDLTSVKKEQKEFEFVGDIDYPIDVK